MSYDLNHSSVDSSVFGIKDVLCTSVLTNELHRVIFCGFLAGLSSAVIYALIIEETVCGIVLCVCFYEPNVTQHIIYFSPKILVRCDLASCRLNEQDRSKYNACIDLDFVTSDFVTVASKFLSVIKYPRGNGAWLYPAVWSLACAHDHGTEP